MRCDEIIEVLELDFSQPIDSRIGFDGPEQWTLKTPLDMSNDAIKRAILTTAGKMNESDKKIEVVWVFIREVLLEMMSYVERGFPEVYDSAVIDRPRN